MPVMTLPIEVLADSRDIESDVSLTLIKQKALEKYVFRHSIDKETQVAYVGYPSITYGRSIGLISHFLDIPENQPALSSTQRWKKVDGNVYRSATPDIEITDRSIYQGGQEIPLFFGMLLPVTTTSASASSYLRRDSDFFWDFDPEARVVYTNIENHWDPALKDFRGINVQYTTEVGGVTEAHTALFRGGSVYKELTINDIDPDTLLPYRGRPVYTLTKLGSPNRPWRFEINGSGPFYVRNTKDAEISVKREGMDKSNQPWLLNVKNGSFISRTTGKGYETVEFENQRFFPYYPYTTQTHRAEVIDKDTLKLPELGLVIDSSTLLNVDVIVRNSEGNLRYLYTTSTQKIGKPLDRWDWDSRELVFKSLDASFDQKNSILSVTNMPPLLSTDQINVQYCVERKSFAYRDLNLNPNFNQRVVDHDYLLYIVPSDQVEDGRSVFHIEYDYIPPNPSTGSPGTTRITSANQSSISSAVLGISLESFKKDYCALVLGWGGNDGNDYQFFPLVTSSFKQSFDVEDVVVQDIRLKTGLDYKNQLDILKKHPWAYFHTVYSEDRLEYPDKFFVCLSVDREHILEEDQERFAGHLTKHLGVGSSLYLKPGGVQPRVWDIRSTVTEVLTLEFMPEKTGVNHLLYQLRDAATLPDPNLDTLLNSYTIPYTNTLHSETISVAALTNDVYKFYIILELPDGSYSEPSKVFEVKIRYA